MFSAARLAPTVAAHSTAPGPAAASSSFRVGSVRLGEHCRSPLMRALFRKLFGGSSNPPEGWKVGDSRRERLLATLKLAINFHTAHHRQQPQALRLAPQSTARSRQGIKWIKFVVQKGAPSEDVRRHRNLRKNWRMSPTRRSGASWAAQWLPRSNSLQETILAWSRSANLRMGRKS
jgi:hypothetical protein